MSLKQFIRTRYLAWTQSTPLPTLPDTPLPVFQSWHAFDTSRCEWVPVEKRSQTDVRHNIDQGSPSQTPAVRLLTWNIDAFADKHEARMDGILSQIQQLLADGQGPHIVFFQEVSPKALAHLLQNAWVREHWVSSEADKTNWAYLPFATMILLSRGQLGLASGGMEPDHRNSLLSLGQIWRVKYPSRYGRDALCCDIFYGKDVRVRLINVHLDSLDCQPNLRVRQVAITSSLLRVAGVGRGLIAGDWNPVSKEDATLIQDNKLVDAWERLRPREDGFTWGLNKKGAPFPPGRLDKVAMLDLKPAEISVVHPGVLVAETGSSRVGVEGAAEEVAWSDHSGLLCIFTLGDGV